MRAPRRAGRERLLSRDALACSSFWAHLCATTLLVSNSDSRDRSARKALFGRPPVSTGRAGFPPIGVIPLFTEVGEVPSCSEPLTAAKPAEVLQLGRAAFVVPDDLVKIEDVYLAGIEFREATADVVEEKAELLVVIGGDQLPPRLPSRRYAHWIGSSHALFGAVVLGGCQT